MKHCTPASFFTALLLSLALPSVASAQPAPESEPTPVPDVAPTDEVAPDEVAPVGVAPDEVAPEDIAPVEVAPVEDAPEEQGPELQLPEEPTTADMVVQAPVVTLGGYGEMHYNAVRPETGPMTNEVDFHRLVLYVGRTFNEDLRFYSEIEVEHAIVGDGKVGEVAIEQAFIDYRLMDKSSPIGDLTLRAGITLVPMGIINQWHEPPLFHGVERPNVDKVIIPSTWREGGVGLVGKPSEQLSYELYIFSGLNPLKFSTKDGIRGGRQKVGEARTDGLAFAGRLQFEPTTQTVLGVSGYFNQAGKNADEVDADVSVLGVSVDARGKYEGVEAKAEFAMFTIGDSDELNALRDAAGDPLVTVADRVLGGYGELAYDVLHTMDFDAQLLPFGRVEYYDTDPDDATRAVTDIVVGLTYRPIPQVAFKQDVTFRRKGGDVDGDNVTILNLGVGFLY